MITKTKKRLGSSIAPLTPDASRFWAGYESARCHFNQYGSIPRLEKALDAYEFGMERRGMQQFVLHQESATERKAVARLLKLRLLDHHKELTSWVDETLMDKSWEDK